MNIKQTEVRLAPPGAGLPLPELIIARGLLALRRATGGRADFLAEFREEKSRLGRILATIPEARRTETVLIRRVRGLEDSSRGWSPLMTLDHLRIVHLSMAHIVNELAGGRVPGGKADTALVKPSPAVTHEVIPAYESSCSTLLVAMESAPTLRTALRYEHPWFGPLDAHGWSALAGRHLRIHRIQLERIRAGLEVLA